MDNTKPFQCDSTLDGCVVYFVFKNKGYIEGKMHQTLPFYFKLITKANMSGIKQKMHVNT